MSSSPPIPALRLSAYYFFYLAGLGAFSPYFPLYLEARGLSPWLISVMMSLWYATRVVAPTAWDHATQRAANPIAWLRGGAIATLVFFSGFLLQVPLPLLVVVMATFAFFYNAIMPQFEAITLSHLAEQPTRYGRIRVWGSIGFIVSVVGLGLAFERMPVSTLPLWMLPLFACVIGTAFANDYGPAHRSAERVHEPLADSLARSGVARFLLLAFLMQVAHGPYYVFFSLYLDESGYRPTWLGTFWAIGVLAEIVVFWFAARLLTRFAPLQAMKLCLLVAAARFVAIALFPGLLPLMVVAQLAHAFTFGLFHAACMAQTHALFPGRLLGQGQGLLYGIGGGLGGVAGSLIAGAMWKVGGGRAAFLAAGGAAALGALCAWRAREAAVRVDPRECAVDEAT